MIERKIVHGKLKGFQNRNSRTLQQVTFMYTHQIEFLLDRKPSDDISDMAFEHLCTLRMNGQVCGREWSLYLNNNHYIAVVLSPERHSLSPKFNGRFVTKNLEKLRENGVVTSNHVLGKNTQGADPCRCKNPSAYVVYTDYVSLESPVRCLDCFNPVPLYKLPTMPSEEYNELISWQSDYQACDGLQMNCSTLEKAATRQISDVQSSLSKSGRAHCQTLEKLVVKPFFYYLYRAHARNLSAEKKHLCPSCKKPWYLETALHSLFHFKCDHCHLVANLAWEIQK